MIPINGAFFSVEDESQSAFYQAHFPHCSNVPVLCNLMLFSEMWILKIWKKTSKSLSRLFNKVRFRALGASGLALSY